MKSSFRNIFLFTPFSLISLCAAAAPGTTNIDNTCKEHSIQIVKTLKEQVITEMSQDQIRAALTIARRSCYEHFGDLPTVESVSHAESEPGVKPVEESETTGNDWFSKYVLEGNPHEKEGVKRLKNRNH